MKGYISNIEKLTLGNKNFRKVLYTDKKMQLVVMSLKPREEIGSEIHKVDQFIRIEKGNGKAMLNGKPSKLGDGSVVIIPSGTKHNIINTSKTKPMKLYTLYAPPEHEPGTRHKTKEDAENDPNEE